MDTPRKDQLRVLGDGFAACTGWVEIPMTDPPDEQHYHVRCVWLQHNYARITPLYEASTGGVIDEEWPYTIQSRKILTKDDPALSNMCPVVLKLTKGFL